jgi:hypothetical protein
MAITAPFEDSASISTTEYSLPADTTTGVPTSQTDDGVYQIYLDLSDLVAGDQFELKVYEKVQSAGTQRLVDYRIFTGAQSPPHVVLPTLILMHGWDVTLKRIAGTDATIGWSIRKVI